MPDLSSILQVVLNKQEVTYGTDPVPAAATDALLVHNYRLRPLVQLLAERNPALKYFGGRESRVLACYHVAEFDVELAGGGAAVDAPVKYASLLASSGMSQTVSAGVSVTHGLITSAIPSNTHYAYLDGALHKLLGARNKAKIVVPGNSVPMIHFEVTGLYAPVTDVVNPTPTLTGFAKGVAVSKANTTPFTLHGYAGVFSNLEIDLGNEIDYVNLPNQEEVKFLDRKVTGSAELATTLVGTKDWYAISRAETLGALAVTHGLVAGNIIQLAGANVKILQPDNVTRNKIRYTRLGLEFLPSAAGNDEFTLTTK